MKNKKNWPTDISKIVYDYVGTNFIIGYKRPSPGFQGYIKINGILTKQTNPELFSSLINEFMLAELNELCFLKYENLISFDIIYIDSFGNAYTNLTKSFFENSVGKRQFNLCLSRVESVDKIHKSYTDVPEGEKVCFFDENGYMIIAINRGRANQLLGLKRESSQLIIEIL